MQEIPNLIQRTIKNEISIEKEFLKSKQEKFNQIENDSEQEKKNKKKSLEMGGTAY